MQTGTLLSSLVLLTATSALVAPLPADEVLKASDHKKLGKKVSEYWVAKDEKKGIEPAFQDLAEEIDKIAKGLEKKDGPPVLAAIDDWKQVFWTATEAGLDEKKVKKGKVTLAQPEGFAEFTYSVGKKYTTRKGPLPLVLIVPDVGESPMAALDTSWEDPEMREGAILVAVHMDGDGSEWGGLAGTTRVMETYGSVLRGMGGFGVDCDRVYLAGSGKGFAAAAATAGDFPQLFAGLIGRGDIAAVTPNNFRNTASYVSGTAGGTSFAAAIGELAFGNCTTGEDTSTAVWAWMQGVTRDAYPTHLTFSPSNRYARSANWIKLGGVDLESSPQVDAIIHRDTNTFEITAKAVGDITVMFNDAMIDLSAPVKVIVNGVEHETLYERNTRRMVDRVYDAGDWGRVFSATADFDVSATE